MSASERRSDFDTVVICAVLGSVLAGATLGTLIASSYVKYSKSLWEAFMMFVSAAVGGVFLALVIGMTIGLSVGVLVSRYIGTSIAHAALTGALTGTSYPVFFLVVGLLTGPPGPPDPISTFALFASLGAICGALAHWLVIGRAAVRAG